MPSCPLLLTVFLEEMLGPFVGRAFWLNSVESPFGINSYWLGEPFFFQMVTEQPSADVFRSPTTKTPFCYLPPSSFFSIFLIKLIRACCMWYLYAWYMRVYFLRVCVCVFVLYGCLCVCCVCSIYMPVCAGAYSGRCHSRDQRRMSGVL